MLGSLGPPAFTWTVGSCGLSLGGEGTYRQADIGPCVRPINNGILAEANPHNPAFPIDWSTS